VPPLPDCLLEPSFLDDALPADEERFADVSSDLLLVPVLPDF
jgi:hypothetical protein